MKKTCFLLAGAVIAGSAAVTGAGAETLEDVLATAYNTNPTLLARRALLRSTDEGVPQALANWRPTVSVTGSAGRGSYLSVSGNDQNSSLVQQPVARSPESYTGTISQPIFRGFRTVSATRQAENTVLAQRALLHATESTILLNAATAYLNVVRDDSVLKLNINNEQVLRRQLEAAQERFRVGEITRTDVSQAEARLSQATADRIAAEGALQDSRANFINFVGRPPESPEAPKQYASLPGTFDEVSAMTTAHNPNIIAADYTYKAALDGVDLIEGELLPTVTLNGNYSRYLHSSTQYSESWTKEVVLNVSMPLYEGGGTYARARAQKHTAGQRRIETDQARRDATEQSTRAWEDLRAARARVKSYEAQIKADELALAGVEEEAKVGSRTVLDVLNAEQELFNARVNLVRAQHDEAVASFTLKSAIGQLTARDLNLQVEVYDPTKHYDDVRGKWIGLGVDADKGYGNDVK